MQLELIQSPTLTPTPPPPPPPAPAPPPPSTVAAANHLRPSSLTRSLAHRMSSRHFRPAASPYRPPPGFPTLLSPLLKPPVASGAPATPLLRWRLLALQAGGERRTVARARLQRMFSPSATARAMNRRRQNCCQIFTCNVL
jgi:hypothetical protein